MNLVLPYRYNLFAACLSLSVITPAAAHHSNAAYDPDHPMTLEGTVMSVNWTNPHITFVVEKDLRHGESGSTWVFETSSPAVLTSSGWTKGSLRPGDHGVFCFAPRRDGSAGGFLLRVTLPNGQELMRISTPGFPHDCH
jgi:hypothetical protein